MILAFWLTVTIACYVAIFAAAWWVYPPLTYFLVGYLVGGMLHYRSTS